MNIALVANTSWSIYNFRLSLIRAFIATGHNVFALAPRDEYSDKLTANGVTYIPINLESYSNSPIRDIRSFLDLLSIYKKNKFDQIIHYTIKANIFGGLAAKFLGLSSYLVVTGLGRTFELDGKTSWAVKKLYKFSIKHSREIWFLNKEDCDVFVAKGLVTYDKTFILPSEGINTRRFIPAEIPKDRKITRFLFAGRLLKDKGILEFVKAAKYIRAKHSKVKFEILGFINPQNKNSISLNDLESWQKNGWINYLGSREDVRPFISRSSCVLFPSFYKEGISRILLEASSMSIPIITTDQVGCKDVVIHGFNGLLFPPRSTSGFIDAIEYFLSLSEEERNMMGEKGRGFVKRNFDDQIIIQYYFKRILKIDYTKIPSS